MLRKSVFVYDDVLSHHVLSESHPMKPVRLQYTHDLLQAYNAFDADTSNLVEPRRATDEELLSHHTPAYIDAVNAIGRRDANVHRARYNFRPGDNPAYEGISDAAVWPTASSLKALDPPLPG